VKFEKSSVRGINIICGINVKLFGEEKNKREKNFIPLIYHLRQKRRRKMCSPAFLHLKFKIQNLKFLPPLFLPHASKK